MVAETGESIPQLIHTAKALQHARRMHREFMLLWALDRAHSLQRDRSAKEYKPEDEIADPSNRDWRSFYRGSVLDD